MRRLVLVLLVSMAVSFAVPSVAVEKFDPTHNAYTLQKLKFVEVLIESLGTTVPPGLTEDRLRVATVLPLRSAGITVPEGPGIDETELWANRGEYLYVFVHPMSVAKGESFVYSVSVELKQMVRIEGVGSYYGATTWESSVIGIAPQAEATEQIVNTVKAKVEAFAADFLLANPKK